MEKNDLVKESVIYADGVKENADKKQLQKIQEVRQLIRKDWKFKEIYIVERERNC